MIFLSDKFPLVLIFIGGGLGSLARYAAGKAFASWAPVFPLGTLAANVFACLILGVFSGWAALRTGESVATYRAFVVVGFCGGFSTFSTFSNDTIQLILNNAWTEACLNVFVSILFCLAATLLGMWLGKQLLSI